ncbi:MAG: diapophytoene dehydrogenase [Bacteroidetes bacterium HGW-Bacteroidetes-4]|jgi:2-oxoglutarate dehydrogenase E2 component (dihydrolipoamide succinyltransferase)|nr:MAG: diapophytoene dehydrogenase [Bacteroidetes bacterium HGW-Bacteroidetes-4]
MSRFELKMPKLGESVQEATITKWMVAVGDTIEEDDNLLEIATDKVDSEIPSPVDGKIVEIFFAENALVPVGEVIALIETNEEADETVEPSKETAGNKETKDKENESVKTEQPADGSIDDINKSTGKFFSPLVKNIAKKENITADELTSIKGTGREGRVTKNDVLSYLDNRGSAKKPVVSTEKPVTAGGAVSVAAEKPLVSPSIAPGDEIIEMDRMRKIIAQYMVNSKRVSPHVTTMVEVDVTNVFLWRKRIKDEFEKREKTKLTFMPIFAEAVAKALRDFPMVNSQVDGERIILKQNVNVGIAVALPSGNLIVPVVKNADKLNLAGLGSEINRLAQAARNNKLNPDEITGGTFTITNFGSFQNVMGTPIINQPEVAILATGSIEKKPAVIESPTGDMIAIRHKMFLSLSYDHRVVDGMLGGMFLRKVADYLEQFDVNRTV